MHPTLTSTPIAPETVRQPWERPALAALLVATAGLYLWGLGASGWANSFYSAAAQAGSESWKAFFFGSSDAANSITVDKTPLALWPMALSVRLFGLSSWSILVPQALFGVASVWLLHHTVRRSSGSTGAGLLAGAVLALTPVAVLMFRFNNPDALLTLLLIGSVAATLRAIEATQDTSGQDTSGQDTSGQDTSGQDPSGRALRWLVLAGALVGLAFLTKMLQAFLVLPALAVTYAVFASVPLARRLGHLLAAFAAMVVAGGWWIAVVELWPADSRPYIGGSQTDSILELTLGYNGFGRLTGEETGSVGGMAGWGETGLTRLFGADLGGQVAWLLPAALVLGAGGLWFARRERRLQAALVVWLGWLLVTGLTFSLMAGIFHAYYTVALAPAIAALVALGGLTLWRARGSLAGVALLVAAALATTVTSYVLLDRATDWLPWLKYAVVTLGLVSAVALLGVGRLPTRFAGAAAGAVVVAALAGPAAYSLNTATTPHTGSIPSAGPVVAAGFGPRGGLAAGGPTGGPPGGLVAGGPPGDLVPRGGQAGTRAPGSDAGSLLEASTPSAELTALLTADAESYTWVAAAVGSQSASGYQLATEQPVMAIGGFNGSDPSPTLALFQEYVDSGQIHYFLAGGQGPGGMPGGMPGGRADGDGGSASSEIATWVAENFTERTVDGVDVYDLTAGASS